VYFFAIETTRRRLASTSSFFACSACASPLRDRLEGAHQLFRRLLELVGHGLDLGLQLLLLLLEVLLSSSFSFGRLRLGGELPLEVGDLALEAHDRLDLVLDLVDHPPLDGLGELDLANQLRHLDLRAHRFPAHLAVLALLLRGRPLVGVVELLLALLGGQPRLADGLDLPQDLLLAVVDLLVGQLLVDEGDQLADAALVVAERVAHLHDQARDGRRARDRLDHRELAALDALGDLDFALRG
jgi:hypothetical protein